MDETVQASKAVVRCVNGHEWPLGTKFCGVCGAKIQPATQGISSLIVGLGGLGGETLLQYCRLPGRASTESLIVVDTSSRDIARLVENASLVKGIAPSFHILSGQAEETGAIWGGGELAAKGDGKLGESLLAAGSKSAESLFLTGALGGSTASGVGPVILDILANQEVGCSKVVLGTIPAEDAPDLAHFNAYCGLSRFLTFKKKRNADFVVLVNERDAQENRQVNAKGQELDTAGTLASILSFLVSAGSVEFTRWLTSSELTNLGRLAGTMHAIPCLALNHSVRVFDSLTSLLESAVIQPLAKVDVKNVVFAPVYLRVTAAFREKMKYENLLNEYNSWKTDTFGKKVGGGLSLAYMQSGSDKLDAMVLLGNCDLDETLRRTVDGYQQIKKTFSRKTVDQGTLSLGGRAFVADDLLQLEKSLSEYIMNVKVLPTENL